MATAISYVSESGDHYLSLYPNERKPNENLTSILAGEIIRFGIEMKDLYIKCVVSDAHENEVVKHILREEIMQQYDNSMGLISDSIDR